MGERWMRCTIWFSWFLCSWWGASPASGRQNISPQGGAQYCNQFKRPCLNFSMKFEVKTSCSCIADVVLLSMPGWSRIYLVKVYGQQVGPDRRELAVYIPKWHIDGARVAGFCFCPVFLTGQGSSGMDWLHPSISSIAAAATFRDLEP